MLMVDEAHATGVFGECGPRAVRARMASKTRVHVRVGTLSKALGSQGGFVAGSQQLIDWLANRARPYVFSTAAPAAVAAAGLAALEIVRTQSRSAGRSLLEIGARLRERLANAGRLIGRISEPDHPGHPRRCRPHDGRRRRTPPPRLLRPRHPPAERARGAVAACGSA